MHCQRHHVAKVGFFDFDHDNFTSSDVYHFIDDKNDLKVAFFMLVLLTKLLKCCNDESNLNFELMQILENPAVTDLR